MTALDRLMAQGQWIETELPDGRTVPSFAMPTPELQSELDQALEANARKRLKTSGFNRVCAPNRHHPFHSNMLRERVDALTEYFWPDLFDREYISEQSIAAMPNEPQTGPACLREHEIEPIIERGIVQFRRIWARGFEKYRDMRKNPSYWRGTFSYKIMFPPEGPPLPDGPPPPPVYIKGPTDLVMSFQNGALHLWIKV
jgi:hypothetical protein